MKITVKLNDYKCYIIVVPNTCQVNVIYHKKILQFSIEGQTDISNYVIADLLNIKLYKNNHLAVFMPSRYYPK